MNRMHQTWPAAAACAGLLAVLPPVGAARADAVADFYEKNRLTIYVGYSAGGGYDQYARLLARHIGRHIPGDPNVTVQNRPGAGSLVLANELYHALPANGAAIGIIGRGIPMDPLFGNDKALFDPTKYTWIGSMNNEVSVCVSWHTSSVKTVEDMLTKRWVVGGTGAGADTDIFTYVINNVLGAHMKLITGYPGGAEINLAVERGELDGRCGWSWSSVKATASDWLKDKKINLLMQMSSEKHPELPDVPFVLDYAKTEKDRKVLELVYSRQTWGRPFLGPPGIPADRAKALQDAFIATMKDPEFLAEAARQKLEISPVPGPRIQEMMVALYQSPKDLVAAASAAVADTRRTDTAKAALPTEALDGRITAVGDGGRSITVEGDGRSQKVRISGSRTRITVAGRTAGREVLKTGMSCTLTHQGSAASALACR